MSTTTEHHLWIALTHMAGLIAEPTMSHAERQHKALQILDALDEKLQREGADCNSTEKAVGHEGDGIPGYDTPEEAKRKWHLARQTKQDQMKMDEANRKIADADRTETDYECERATWARLTADDAPQQGK